MTQTSGSSTIEITTDPAKVWEILTDFSNLGDLSPEAYKAEWEDGATSPEPGATFRGYNQQGDLQWDTLCLVIGAKPGVEWSFAASSPAGPATIWRYLIDETARGCRVTETFDSPSLLADYFQQMTPPRDGQLRKNISTTLANLKQLAEAG